MPRRLRRLEPLACFALAGHALAVQFVAGASWLSPTIFAAMALTGLGLAGVLGWKGRRAVTIRAFSVLVLAYSQMAIGAPGSGYFLLWFFVLVSVYPLVLPRRASLALVIASPVAYLLLLPLGAADGPAPVALLRAVSLWLIGTFVHTAATAYRAAADSRNRALALLDVYVDSTPVGLGFWDPSLRFRRLNAALAQVSGFTIAEHLGRKVQEIPAVPSEIGVNLHRVLTSGQPVDDVEVEVGDRVWTSSYFPVRVEADLVGVGAVLTETTDQRAAARALSHSATHDALTGLPNRVLFVDRVGVALAQAARTGGVVAVLFCDVDRFKLINDSLGHPAGDDLLRLAGARLSRVVRPGDTVARLGGDEFALICTSIADVGEARSTAERVCAVLREPMQIRGRVITSTASVGVVVCAAGQRDVQKVLRDADIAMYQAKDGGRDQVAMFDESIHGDAAERLEFQWALRRAVERNHITVTYQPIVALRDLRSGVGSEGLQGDGAWAAGGGVPAGNNAVGVEALARWYRPGHGPVSPAVFIPIAEDLGLIHALGAGVLRQACTSVRRWRDELHRPLTAAVNLSARQLASDTCVSSIASILDDAGLPPSALQLEITESVLMVDLERSQTRLSQLRDLGVGLAIDDFGTGYSSLAYLRDLPVDVLKIDRSFTSRLPADAAMFSFIVDLARALGATTVVEGVETLEQLQLVAQLGCDHAQGYYLSRPLDPDGAARFLLGASATAS